MEPIIGKRFAYHTRLCGHLQIKVTVVNHILWISIIDPVLIVRLCVHIMHVHALYTYMCS